LRFSFDQIMRIPDERTCAFLLACLLCSMLLLSEDAEPPFIPISDLASAEDGAVISTEGLVASLHRYDSGAESLILVDVSGCETARIVCSPGGREMPSFYLSVGDAARATGEISFEGTAATMFCDSDGILLLKKAAHVLDVAVLSSNWELFEGDRLNVSGVLENAGRESWYLLRDSAGTCSMSARAGPDAGVIPVGVEVVVDCTMILDKSTMAFVLLVWSAEVVVDNNPFVQGSRWPLSWPPLG